MKTVITQKGYLYLRHELQQHYTDIYKRTHSVYLSRIKKYLHFLITSFPQYQVFIVPDKSIVCKSYLPQSLQPAKIIYRMVDFLHQLDYLHDPITRPLLKPLIERDYYLTDSHINYLGALKMTYYIIKSLYPNNNYQTLLASSLDYQVIPDFLGDLTLPQNLNYQESISKMNLPEWSIIISNRDYPSYPILLSNLESQYQTCLNRRSKYVGNSKSIVNDKLLILGDSSCNHIFPLISFFFKETLFYWNHMTIPYPLIQSFEPDKIIDIRTERFLCIPKHMAGNIKPKET